jgi:3-dehydroquinate synthase
MQVDKKSRGGNLRFVVLDEIAKPTVMLAPTEEILFAAFQEIAQ